MDVNIQNYEYLYELLKIAQNCLKVLIPAHKNLLKIAQNTCPQNLLKIAQNCSKSLKIAQNRSNLLKIAQNC